MSDYLNELKLPNRILLGPGPSNVHPRVLQAMLWPMLGHLDPDFWPVLDQVRDMLRLVLGTTQNWTLPLPATGTAGMESAFCNVVEPGDRVVIVVNGFFGGRMVEIASRCGADVQRIDVPWGKPVLPEIVAQALSAQGRVKAVGVVHAETSTGVLSPIQEIAQVVHNHDALLIVDAVTSLGGVELYIDDWDIDICYGVSQKCLGAPPGLAPISLGRRAVEVLTQRKSPVQSFYLDMVTLADYWSERRRYHHTAPILMLYAFREALRLIMEEGLRQRWQRHAHTAAALRAGLQALELELFADANYRLDPLTTIVVPENVDAAQVQRQLYQEYNIEIGGGLGDLQGKIWRIGLMGDSCKASNVLLVLSALEHILARQGYAQSHGAGVAAAQQIFAVS
ncbi:MAG TPA: alanine--glyoxylate aminotransferase family protein [Candidatus Tectomicrobia bacterium]|jgi:alanine-glyoxylate transaminase/serine-glyoxylate transaminase/serine-pyruvate transaminase